MMVLVVTACPAGLRGDLTKWLMEIAPGTFVGDPTARIRDLLWERTRNMCKDGQALMVFNAKNEQGMEFRTHRHKWQPMDFDGLTLMSRRDASADNRRRTGWSNARHQRRKYKGR